MPFLVSARRWMFPTPRAWVSTTNPWSISRVTDFDMEEGVTSRNAARSLPVTGESASTERRIRNWV